MHMMTPNGTLCRVRVSDLEVQYTLVSFEKKGMKWVESPSKPCIAAAVTGVSMVVVVSATLSGCAAAAAATVARDSNGADNDVPASASPACNDETSVFNSSASLSSDDDDDEVDLNVSLELTMSTCLYLKNSTIVLLSGNSLLSSTFLL